MMSAKDNKAALTKTKQFDLVCYFLIAHLSHSLLKLFRPVMRAARESIHDLGPVVFVVVAAVGDPGIDSTRGAHSSQKT